MNFVTVEFLLFLLAVFVVYWHLNRKHQNLFLVLASYFFYANWDWRFLGLIVVSTAVDFISGPRIYRADSSLRKRAWLILSLTVNLGILGYFKYFNFFAESFVSLANSLGWYVSHSTANIILPVGISFYTFQTLSYSIDIYRGELKPTKSLVEFAAFVAFFPQLVAGPIVRAKEFLFQLEKDRVLTGKDLDAGLTRFLLGFFKKAFIADTLAIHVVDPVFSDPGQFNQGTLWLALLAWGFQVYADFSGYSNMAIGSARILGFRIPENFLFPHLAVNFSDIWRRWHQTMTRFFRDYVYIALGGNRGGLAKTIRNLTATTVLSGLWHGASWNFVAFGISHGVAIGIYQIWRHYKRKHGWGWKRHPIPGALIGWLLTHAAWCVPLVVFRASDLPTSWSYMVWLFGKTGETLPALPVFVWIALASVVVDHIAGWLLERDPELPEKIPVFAKGVTFAAMIIFLYTAVPRAVNPFIYFQF